MRTKQDINGHQCDKCGKIQREGEFTNGAEGTEWEGLALCDKCTIEQEKEKN